MFSKKQSYIFLFLNILGDVTASALNLRLERLLLSISLSIVLKQNKIKNSFYILPLSLLFLPTTQYHNLTLFLTFSQNLMSFLYFKNKYDFQEIDKVFH